MVDDLINRDELVNMSYKLIEPEFNDVMQLIYSQHPVDAVEVVRCKDCKHYEKRTDFLHGRCNRLIIPILDDDFYCKWGEKE